MDAYIGEIRDKLEATFNECLVNLGVNFDEFAAERVMATLSQNIMKRASPMYQLVNSGYHDTFDDLSRLMESMSHRFNREKIYIYIEDVGKYVMFNDEQAYSAFIQAVRPTSPGAPNTLPMSRDDFKIYQVILLDRKQRLILTYNSKHENITREVCEKTKEYFGVEVVMIHNDKWGCEQMLIDIIMDCYNDNSKYCEQLYIHLENERRGLGQGLSVPPITSHPLGARYIIPLVAHTDCYNNDDFIKSLPTHIDMAVNDDIVTIPNHDDIVSMQSQQPTLEPTENIYLIVDEPYRNRVKIGRTEQTLDARRKQLETGAGPLKVIHSVTKAKKCRFESYLHKLYAGRRTHGEWFVFLEDELDELIKNVTQHADILRDDINDGASSIINNVVNNINISAVNIDMKTTENILRQWIRENPPKNMESTESYYSAYRAEMVKANIYPVSKQTISKELRQTGYSNKKLADNKHHWIK